MRLYRRFRVWLWKRKAIRNADLIMLLSESSIIHNMRLVDLTWINDHGDGLVIGVQFLVQHQIPDTPVIRIKSSE